MFFSDPRAAKALWEWLNEEVVPPITATGYKPVVDDPIEDVYDFLVPRRRWEVGLEAATSPLIPSTLLSKGLRKGLNAALKKKARESLRLDLAKGGEEAVTGTVVPLEDVIRRPEPKRNPRLEAKEVKRKLEGPETDPYLGPTKKNIWERIDQLEDRAQMHYTAAGEKYRLAKDELEGPFKPPSREGKIPVREGMPPDFSETAYPEEYMYEPAIGFTPGRHPTVGSKPEIPATHYERELSRNSGRVTEVHGETIGSAPISEKGLPPALTDPNLSFAEHKRLAERYENEAKDLRKAAEQYKSTGELPHEASPRLYKGEIVEPEDPLVFRPRATKGAERRGGEIKVKDPYWAGGHAKVARLREQLAAAGDPYKPAGKTMGPYRKGSPLLPETMGSTRPGSISPTRPSAKTQWETTLDKGHKTLTPPDPETAKRKFLEAKMAEKGELEKLAELVPEHLREEYYKELRRVDKEILEAEQMKARITVEGIE
jgi:hypothetical protein